MAGALDSIFGGGKPEAIYYNKGVNKNLNYLGNQFQGDDTSIQNALNAFKSANASTIANLNAAGTKAGNEYDNLYAQNANYNPLDTYNSLRTGNLNALKDWSGQLEGAGSANDKLALAAMGMGGTPDSSYGSILRADRVSKNIAPVLGNIMSSLGNDTNTIGNQRNQNFQNQMGIIGQQTSLPMLGYGMQLDPANALLALRGGQVGQLGNMANVAKDNTSGYYTAPGAMDYWDRAMQSLGRTASVAGQIEGDFTGTGGMTGGGGGSSGAFNGFKLGGMTPTAGGSSQPASGAGGMNMNSLASLLKMFGVGGQQPQASTTAPYDPWSNYNANTDPSLQPPANFGNYNTQLWP